MNDRLDRHDELIGKIFSQLSRLEAEVSEFKAWKHAVMEDTRRMWDHMLPDLSNRIGKIEDGIGELKGLLAIVQNVSALQGEVEEVRTRLSRIERIKDQVKARFDSQTEWRIQLGRIGIAAGLAVIGYGMIELLKWILS